jgi:hypothetical protein
MYKDLGKALQRESGVTRTKVHVWELQMIAKKWIPKDPCQNKTKYYGHQGTSMC